MEVTITGCQTDNRIIRELLRPWNVTFSTCKSSNVEIACGRKPVENGRAIVIPSDSSDFSIWANQLKLGISKKPGRQTWISAGSAKLVFFPKNIYCNKKAGFESSDGYLAENEINSNVIVLTVDIVREFYKILNDTLNAKSSTVYKMLTSLPIDYNIAPSRLKDLLMKRHGPKNKIDFSKHLPLDALRFILVQALERISGKKLSLKSWFSEGKKYACVLTHDIETHRGFQNSRFIKQLEDKYDIPSVWFIPSNSYSLDKSVLAKLTCNGEVGAHDTKHDGKLAQFSGKELTNRLQQSKIDLEKATGSVVAGFRAPLLQHSDKVLDGLKKVGYKYDASVPTWEPKHPRTMLPHGLGTVFPLILGRNHAIVEIPLTLVQDHQMLHVLGLKPSDVIKEWLSTVDLIKELGGCCIFLSHPEYELLDRTHIALYEEVLNFITADKQAWIGTATQLANETAKRSNTEFESR